VKWLLAVLALAGLAAVATHGHHWTLPDRHNPWAPLHYAEPPNWLTRHKLQRLATQPEACLALMASTPWRFQPIADRDTGPGCGMHDAIQVQRTAVSIGQPLAMTCAAAASLALWERHVLQPQAQLWFGMPVRSIEHYGSYACRNVAGSSTGRRSEHATANAVDLAGFVLQDGRRVSVARDWGRPGPAAQFLQSVHQGACGLFTGALGPAYNQAHADHFHFDRGPFGICR
jgi:hypothetical protein